MRSLSAAAMLFASVASCQAYQTPDTPPQNVEDALHQMSDRAGIIFAGQVISVRRQNGGDGEDGASGVVEIEFHVDQAVRGCAAGTSYVLREWAGLWSGGVQRYRVGQRLLLFLHAPSASGMSSPVDGMDGIVPIHGDISALVATGSTTSQYPYADLRWIATHVIHPVTYQAESAQSSRRAAPSIPSVVVQSAAGAIRATGQDLSIPSPAAPDSGDRGASSVPAQQISVQTAIGTLKSWQKAQHVAR